MLCHIFGGNSLVGDSYFCDFLNSVGSGLWEKPLKRFLSAELFMASKSFGNFLFELHLKNVFDVKNLQVAY